MDNKKNKSGKDGESPKDEQVKFAKHMLSKLLKQVQSSPLPWSCEENADSTWFIYDKNSHIVADEISNEGDAMLIVSAVNYFGSLR